MIICAYRFPPCIGFNLILPCASACGEVLRFFVICYDRIMEHVNDQAVWDHFTNYRCRLAESYYAGYGAEYFSFDDERCINIPDG